MAKYVLLADLPAEVGSSPEPMAEAHARWTPYGRTPKDSVTSGSDFGSNGDAATAVRACVRGAETQIAVGRCNAAGPFAEAEEYPIATTGRDEAPRWVRRLPSGDYGSVGVRSVLGA